MRMTALAVCGALLLGCGSDVDLEGEDFEDPKSDRADDHAPQPGLYLVVEPEGGFAEGATRKEILDLRKDGTFFSYSIGAVLLDEYNWSEGVAHTHGTYKLTRDRYDNRYLRFTVDDHSWREKYAVSGTTLRIFWRDGESYTMKRQPAPAAGWVADVQAGYEAGERMYQIENIYADDVPTVLRDRSYDLDDIYDDLKMFRLNVGDAKAYVIRYGYNAEIYAANDQLLAVWRGDAWGYSLY